MSSISHALRSVAQAITAGYIKVPDSIVDALMARLMSVSPRDPDSPWLVLPPEPQDLGSRKLRDASGTLRTVHFEVGESKPLHRATGQVALLLDSLESIVKIFPSTLPTHETEYAKRMRSILFHEIAHALDPEIRLHDIPSTNPNEDYKKYLNSRAEIRARLSEVAKQLRSRAAVTEVDNAFSKVETAEDDSFARWFANPGEWADRHSPVWAGIQASLTPSNKRLFLKVIADAWQEALELTGNYKRSGPVGG